MEQEGWKQGAGGTEGRSLAGEWREGAGGSDVAGGSVVGAGGRERGQGPGGKEGRD